MTNRIDASVDRMQPANGEPVLDRSTPEAQLHELTSRNHPVLARREPGDPHVG